MHPPHTVATEGRSKCLHDSICMAYYANYITKACGHAKFHLSTIKYWDSMTSYIIPTSRLGRIS